MPRTFPRRKTVAKDKKIKSVVNKMLKIKGLIPEKKFVTSSISDASVDTLGIQTSLCLIAQGDEFYERQGMQIAVSKIEIDVLLAITATSQRDISTWDNPLNALYIDRQSNGAFPLEIFSIGNAGLLASDAPFVVGSDTSGSGAKSLYFRNPLMSQRYRHLMDGTHLMQGGDWEYLSTVPTYNNIMLKRFKYTKTFKTPVIVHYDDVTATSDCIVKNNFVLAIVPIHDEIINYTAFSKLTYTDV